MRMRRLLLGSVVACGVVLLLVRDVMRQEKHLRARAHAVQCQVNLRSIGQALHMYADRNGGVYPDTLDRLRADTGLPPAAYACPAAPNQATSRYIYAGDGLTRADEVREDIVVAFERPGSHHHPEAVGILRADGRVEWLVNHGPVLDQFAAGIRPITTPLTSTRRVEPEVQSASRPAAAGAR